MFSHLFSRITLFHQNESRFELVFNLSDMCRVSYRTCSSYKSQIYCHRPCELHHNKSKTTNLAVTINRQQQNKTDKAAELDSMRQYVTDKSTFFDDIELESHDDQKQITIRDIIKSYVYYSFTFQSTSAYFTVLYDIRYYFLSTLMYFSTLSTLLHPQVVD